MRTLSTKTNVIPVIAKADTLSSEEKAKLKEKINKELSRLDIKVYPSAFADDKEACQDVEPLAPFTLIGSNKTIDNGTKKIRGRVYRWGFAEVENPAHCDFVHLRSMIMK